MTASPPNDACPNERSSQERESDLYFGLRFSETALFYCFVRGTAMKPCVVWLASLILAFSAGKATAGDCCAHCGCQSNCCKVCRLVCDTKKVPKITYDCECEDFCIPGRSSICGYTCECDCECDCGKHCHKKPNWIPSCGKVHTRHVLVKKEEIKEVKTYKCVVENLCPTCVAKCQCQKPNDEALASRKRRWNLLPSNPRNPKASWFRIALRQTSKANLCRS